MKILLQHEAKKVTQNFRNLFQAARAGNISADVAKVKMFPWVNQTMVTSQHLETLHSLLHSFRFVELDEQRRLRQCFRMLRSFLNQFSDTEE